MPSAHRLCCECVWEILPGLSINKADGSMIVRKRQISENMSHASSLVMTIGCLSPSSSLLKSFLYLKNYFIV